MIDQTLHLHRFPFSNFCEKALWALDYKGAFYTTSEYLPFAHMRPIRKLSGQTAVPVLEAGGMIITGSANIVAYVDQAVGGEPLIPAEESARAKALEWQERLDEIGPIARGAMFYDFLNDKAFFKKVLTDNRRDRSMIGYNVLFKVMTPLLVRMLKKRAPDADKLRQDVQQMLDDVAQASSSGHLVADRFTIADLTAASILYPLFMPEGTTGAELVKSDPTGQRWLERWADHPAGVYVKATYSKFRTAKPHS